METKEAIQLAREHERMRMALLAIKAKAEAAVFGGWRQEIQELALEGLRTD